jgi:hypothetical protein
MMTVVENAGPLGIAGSDLFLTRFSVSALADLSHSFAAGTDSCSMTPSEATFVDVQTRHWQFGSVEDK